jgi:outer membrane protein assembly factor BamB
MRISMLRFLPRCILVCFLVVARSGNAGLPLPWPDKAGPLFNGHVPADESRDLPISWSEETGENIRWKVPVEGQGLSTPVIGQGKLWFTSANVDGTGQFVYCLDEESGKTLLHKLLFENADPEPLGNKVNTYASPSCVLEPDAVYVHFGTYGTARLNPETGDIVWQRRDIRCRHYRGPGSSPVLFENLLILTFDGIDQQFLMALDKHTGKTVWRTDRSTNYDDLDQNGKPRGDGDYRKAFSTPGLVEVAGRTQLVSVGSRAAFGYDARTGSEIWTVTHADFNAAARPVFSKDHVFINTGSGRANLMSVRLDDTTRGNVDKTHVEWDREKGNSELSNPLLMRDRLFMVANNGIVFCVDIATGKDVWKERLGGTFVASPILANGLIYFSNEEGETTVVRAGDTFQQVSKNVLLEGARASPAIANGALFLRTFGHLYKIAKQKE